MSSTSKGAQPISLPTDWADERAAGVPAPLLGLTLGERYRLVRLLGKGGMGAVYLARHVLVGKPVAVKILDSACVADGQGFQRLFREAQAAAAIGHPAIIDVQDVGVTPEGDPYLVMEYLEGEDLSSLMERHAPLSLAAALGVLEPILSALRAAHAKGIVHRDLKPANIYLVRRPDAPPAVKLIDFGVAKMGGPSDLAKITLPGTVLGTPAYMAPEQARGGRDVDARTDIYAIGVVLFQVLTNRLPFEGANYNELVYRIIHDSPTLTDSVRKTLRPDVSAVILRAMEKEQVNRFQTASEMLDALRALEGWSDRAEALGRLASRIHVHAFGGGDLGGMPHREPGSEIDVFELIRRDAQSAHHAATRAVRSEASSEASSPERGSPIDAPPTLASGRSPVVQPNTGDKSQSDDVAAGSLPMLQSTETASAPAAASNRTRRGAAWTITAIVAVVLGGVGLWRATQNPPPPATASSISAPVVSASQDGVVRITLQGAPPDASIWFNGAPVHGNPFRVGMSEASAVLRVEASGFEPFVTTVVPLADVTMTVTLVPAKAAGPAPSASAAGSAHDSPPTSRVPKGSPSGIGKGGRDTYYTEKFE